LGADEEGTLERLKALRRELLDPKIAAPRADKEDKVTPITRRTRRRRGGAGRHPVLPASQDLGVSDPGAARLLPIEQRVYCGRPLYPAMPCCTMRKAVCAGNGAPARKSNRGSFIVGVSVKLGPEPRPIK